MRKAAAVLSAILLLAGCDRAPGLSQLAPGEEGRVAQVRSGDVMVLDSGLTVRLAGIAAPHAGEPYADESRAELARLAAGKAVTLSYGGARRDSYGRALAQVRLDRGGWLQGALLEAGAARVRTYADNRALAAPMLDAEARARAKRRGLWGLAAYRVRLPGEVDDRERGFLTVEGRVIGADARRLDFGRGFSAEIAPAAEGDFAAAGKAPEVLRGRLVRVRGTMGWSGALRLDHPEQVELLRDR